MADPRPVKSGIGRVLTALSLTMALAGSLAFAPSASPAAQGCEAPNGQLLSISVGSLVYNAPVPVSVYLPPCYAESTAPVAAIYLLHGAHADETQWPDLRVQPEVDAAIARGARPFVVVMPGGEYAKGRDYEVFVLSDLLPAIESQFRVSAVRSSRAIGGLSLGGYWALKIAFKHPELFAAVGGYSPLVSRGLGDDPLALASAPNGLNSLRIALDVGDGDPLRDESKLLARTLLAHGVAVSLTIQPGTHNRAYWRAHTAQYLDFDLQALNPSHPQPPCQNRGAAWLH